MIPGLQHLTLGEWYYLLGSVALICTAALFMYRKAGRPLWAYLMVRKQRIFEALESVEIIRAEVFPNGGSSMRDEVQKTALAVGHISILLGDLAKRVAMSVAQNRQLFDQTDIGLLEGDVEGEVVWANRALRKLTGLRIEQIVGSGWINAVHDDDRRRVENDWRLATAHRRQFIAVFRLVHVGSGAVIAIHCEASPVMVDGRATDGAGWIALFRTREVEQT